MNASCYSLTRRVFAVQKRDKNRTRVWASYSRPSRVAGRSSGREAPSPAHPLAAFGGGWRCGSAELSPGAVLDETAGAFYRGELQSVILEVRIAFQCRSSDDRCRFKST